MTNEELLKKIRKAKASGATRLDLSGNQLTALPLELFQFTSLIELNLSGNQLTILPPDLAQLTSLIKLDLSGNLLTTLPPGISFLKNLTTLNLSGNLFSALPQEICKLRKLAALDLSGNQLTTLPPEICHLSNLEEIYLYDNPITSPPLEIAEKGIEAIQKYFEALDKGNQPLNEVKILFVGEGAAGKTSLVKQLFGQLFDEHEDTTHGISIKGWEQEVGGRQIRINIWDFGGQEIQHATHQFFLSKRSLYVLVLDGRKDERTEYWLRHIEAFGGDSPVLIVLNKIDSNASFDVNRPFLLEKYPGIRDFFRVSCKSGQGVADFKKNLLTELAQVEMIGTVWPHSWFAVKRRLEQMDRPYISAEDCKGICEEAGITEAQSCEVLIDFLHDLGVAVHFKDFILDAMHVLDPVWVTEAVYKIITAEKMVESKGVLHLNALKEILKEQPIPLTERALARIGWKPKKRHCCPPDTHPYIMGLMEKFELCYPVGKEAVLIPQLLPVSEPPFAFDYGGSLRFALHYPDFLPPSVFPRFMVKAHRDIKAETCWRTGVLLEDQRSGAQALVKADIEARRINIWVQGDRRREYLHYLRYTLADINSSFEKLKLMELVPMPDAQDITADYATLLEYAKNDIDQYIPAGSTKVYSVRELLGLVQPKDTDELVRVAEKATPQDTVTWVEILNETVEPKWTVPVLGITLNLKGFFEKLLARQKQKQQQARR